MDHNFFAPPYNYRTDLPLAEKWKHLKLIVTQLYEGENRTVEEVRDIIHRQCGFDAGIHQLKYRIRQWKLKKNIPTSAKTIMLEIKESRASRGMETAFNYQGKPVDNKKLDRQAKVLDRQAKVLISQRLGNVLNPKIAARIFVLGNVPFQSLRYSQTILMNLASPNVVVSTPSRNSDIIVSTPRIPGTPSHLVPAADHLSGLSGATRNMTLVERATMFLEGKHDELLLSMDKSEQKIMSEWLYQFWLYAFKTPSLGVIKVWSPLEKQGEDIFIEKLLSGLSRNDFSHLDDNDISIALLRLLTIFNVSADQLLGEFLAFGIISRNFELVWSVLDNASRRRANLKDMFPFHLATSYLGSPYGFSSAFDLLFHDKFANTAQIREMYVNDRGHTVLDSLMIAIIKAHTSCVPGDVDEKMEGQRRFVGEEVDICGRWDATYSEIRFRLAHRLAQGWSGVPFDWKHSFCNTSTWAICKSISFMFDAPRKPDVNHRSGLFRKRCQHCMQECTLLPLHTLVMVAFRLAQQGREHEDLFGISACLSYLLSRGANPLLGSVLSATMLYGTDGNLGCTHEILTPLQLVKCIPRGILQHWSPALRRGWSMLGHLLRHSEGVWISPQPDDFHCNACSMITDTDGDATESNIAANDDSADKGSRRYPRCEPGSLHHFKGSRLLRDFYAAVETELLTDRQCHPWNHWAKNWSHRYTAFRRVLELLRPRLECSGTKCSLLLGGNCDFLFPRE